MKYLQIILNLPVNQPFTYSYSPDENEKPELIPMIGKRAEIMFGNRKTTGFIVDILDEVPPTCPVEKEKIPEVADSMQRPQNTAPKIQKTPVKIEFQEKKISVVVPIAPKKEKESKPVALPEKKI